MTRSGAQRASSAPVSAGGAISNVVVAVAGTRRLVSLVKRGCTIIQGGGGRITIVSLSTLPERLAARYSLTETWIPMVMSDDLVAGRMPTMVEALLVCPRAIAVDYEILVDWTPRSALRTVLRAAPDAVVLDKRLPALRRALHKHFVLDIAGHEADPEEPFFRARRRPEAI
jgi:hypothetical protein